MINRMLTHTQYGVYISRKTPCIIFYEDQTNATNKDVITIMENMKKEFKYVLCYKFDWRKSFRTHRFFIHRRSSDVLTFRNNQLIFKISAYNEDGLRNLFRTVYNDSVCKFLSIF